MELRMKVPPQYLGFYLTLEKILDSLDKEAKRSKYLGKYVYFYRYTFRPPVERVKIIDAEYLVKPYHLLYKLLTQSPEDYSPNDKEAERKNRESIKEILQGLNNRDPDYVNLKYKAINGEGNIEFLYETFIEERGFLSLNTIIDSKNLRGVLLSEEEKKLILKRYG